MKRQGMIFVEMTPEYPNYWMPLKAYVKKFMEEKACSEHEAQNLLREEFASGRIRTSVVPMLPGESTAQTLKRLMLLSLARK
jgi:hypothetical protein